MMRQVERLLVGLIAAVSLFAFLANPILGVPGCDSSIFIYVARRMMAGQVPYLDVFDQKGLLIYVLDAVGWKLGGVMGIWLLDVLAFALGMVGCVWIGRAERGERGERCAAVAVWIVMYHLVACGGNMPEMWIIVFSALAYVLALKARAEESWKWMVMGACVAQILMLKLNMIAVVVPIGIVWGLRGTPVRTAMMAFVGFVAGFAPYAVYLTMTGAWGALWEVYVQYNAQYAAHGGWMPSISRAFYPVAVLWGVNLWMALRARQQLARINLAYLTAAWGLVLLSGGSVRYYGPVLPACVIPLVFVVEKIPCRRCVLVLALMAVTGLAVFRNRPAAAIRGQYEELLQIRGQVEDLQSVTVLGCDCHVYQTLDAVCPGRFPFQGTVARCSEVYRRTMTEDLVQGKSRYLIVPRGALENPKELGIDWAVRPIRAQYSLKAQTSHYQLFESRE